MKIGPTEIEDSFAEAFEMRYARVVVTAIDEYWCDTAIAEFTGFGTSIIACDVEAAREQRLAPAETPDGRPGASVLIFGFSTDALAKAIPRRAGQCLLTCPTTAVFDGLGDSEKRIALGSYLRYFGDGFQRSKVVAGKRYWRLPVLDGEFLVEESLGIEKGVAGGCLLIQATSIHDGLRAARSAVTSLADMPGVILPFPGGVVRSGSKVGSRYDGLRASTNDALCPTLRGRVTSQLHPETTHAYELVIDGVDEATVAAAMATAARAAAGEGIVAISAPNYGGKLGKYHFHLHEILR